MAVTQRSSQRPAPDQVVQALLNAEKASKRQKAHYSLSDLIGSWQLCFITGTRKTRQRAGVVLGAGRYVPSWVTISLSYAGSPDVSIPDDSLDDSANGSAAEVPFEAGNVINQVQFGLLQTTLSGPAKLLTKNNILAFDFTRIKMQLSHLSLYQGSIRGGKTSETNFYEAKLGKQAFFNYFLVEKDILAARGRGGGLALWGRQL